MTTITFIRPSGNPITVNDTPENRAYAAENGWTEQGAEKKPQGEPAPRVGRPRKDKSA